MNNIENNICKAIELMVNSSLEKAKYDQTIQGVIYECEDKVLGKYKIKYQDSYFYAHTTDPEINYTNGSLVYILVPNGDLNQDKIILGRVDKLGTDYISILEEKNKYNVIGNNIISNNKLYNLSSYAIGEQDDTYIQLIYPNGQTTIDETSANEYLRQSPSMLIGASFKTNLPEEQKYQGNYGIIFGLDFYKNYDEKKTEEVVTRYYSLDVNDMKGNPYNFERKIEQYKIFDIDSLNFKSISSISLFVKDFPNSDINFRQKLDIAVDDIKLLGMSKITDEDLQGCGLTLETPHGSFFDKNANPEEKLDIVANLKIKGEIVNPKTEKNLSFYWFKEDLTIDSKSKYFNKYGGLGWKCLNDFNLIKDEGQENGQVEWIADKNQYFVYCKDLFSQSTKFKCVAIYNDISYNKQIIIKNLNEKPIITIESDSGVNFFYDLGHPTLTCLVSNEIQRSYSYKWGKEDKYGHFELLKETGYQLKDIVIAEISDFAKFKCSVYDTNNNLLGTGEITLTNSYEQQSGYSLVIDNGVQNFQYDENGESPASSFKDHPIAIPQLSFSIYDDKGNLLTDILNSCDIQWKVPTKNTMITGILQSESEVLPDGDPDYHYYTKTQVLDYKIRNDYKANYKNNTIQLTVKYKQMTLTAYTNLTFIKQGEQGTNGSVYNCKIVPLRGSYEDFPTLTVYTDKGIQYAYFNFGINGKTFIKGKDPQGTTITGATAFKIKVYNRGEEVYNGVESSGNFDLKWSILKNKYNKNLEDPSNLTISEKDGIISYQDTTESVAANIIQCTISIKEEHPTSPREELVITTSLPIAIARVQKPEYQILPKSHTGFRYVTYSGKGVNPQYDSTNPFTVETLNVQPLSYLWSILGKSYISDQFIDSYDLRFESPTQELNTSTFSIVPANTYTGLCVTNAVMCYCEGVGSIHIPIHLLLNRYSNSRLNDWNGNSIQINEEGGYILSPQMGAGRKETDNSFTGVLMGEVKEPNKKQPDVGLFGYKNGAKTFSLDSETGVVTLGIGAGQLAIDPSQDKALLYSGNFWKNQDPQTGLPSDYSDHNKKGEGMLIDLTTPSIEFGNGSFKITEKELSINLGGQDVESTLKDSVKDVKNLYALSTSQTEMLLITEWLDYPPAVQEGEYLWQKTITIYNNGKTEEKCVCLSGADGKTSYIHIAYGELDQSNNMKIVEDKYAKTASYIGQYTDYNIESSKDPNAYTWSLIKGLNGHKGDQGLPGNDGSSVVTIATGITNMSKSEIEEDSIIGKISSWEKKLNVEVKENDICLVSGITNDSNQNWSIYGKVTNYNTISKVVTMETVSTTLDGLSEYTHVAYMNNIGTGIPDKNGNIIDENGNIINEKDNFSTSNQKNTDLNAIKKYGEFKKYIGMYVDNIKSDSKFWTSYKWSKFVGDPGKQGIPGENGYSLHIAYMDTLDNSDHSFSVEEMYKVDGTPKKYIGQYTDRTSDDSQDYTRYKWSRYIGENGAPGINGHDGKNGLPGKDGKDGVSTFSHIAWAMSSDGSKGFSTTDSVGKTYIGMYVDETRADSEDYRKYHWSLTKGTDGKNGLPGKDGTNGSNGKTAYLHIAYATSADGSQGFSVDNSVGKTYIGQYTDHTEADSGDYHKYTWSLIKGADGKNGAPGKDGKDGNGINSVTTSYLISVSSLPPTVSSVEWKPMPEEGVPAAPKGQYLWIKTVIDYTDPTVQDTVTITYSKDGQDGQKGQDGTSVSVKSILYQEGSSSIDPPTGNWVDHVVSITPGNYLWTKTIFSDGQVAYGISKQGIDGKDGNGIKSTAVAYALSETLVDPTNIKNWYSKENIPNVKSGQYLWTRTITDYTDTKIKDTITYTYSKMGNDGKPGEQGQAGTSVSVKRIDYQAGSSATQVPTEGAWTKEIPTVPAGMYLWTRTILIESDKPGQEKPVYSVSKQGEDAAITSDTPPEDTSQLWCDTSEEPPVIKRFNEKTGEWEIIGDYKGDIGKLTADIKHLTSIVSDEENGLVITAKKVADMGDTVTELGATLMEITGNGVNMSIQKTIDDTLQNAINDGLGSKIQTTDYSFDSDGFRVGKSDSKLKTTITENGMTVSNDQTKNILLTANDQGVEAKNLHATTYLIIGENSRLEDFGVGRTACFWIGK